MGKRELVALLSLSSWYLVIVVWLFLSLSLVCLRFVIVVFPDHTHLLFLIPLLLGGISLGPHRTHIILLQGNIGSSFIHMY